MSDKVATVRRMYEMFAKGEIPQLIQEMMAPTIVMHIPGKEIGGDKVGHAGAGQFFQTLGERTDTVEVDIHDVTESDEHVVVILNLHETSGDKRLDMPAVHIWHIHDGKAMEMWELVRDTTVWDEFYAR